MKTCNGSWGFAVKGEDKRPARESKRSFLVLQRLFSFILEGVPSAAVGPVIETLFSLSDSLNDEYSSPDTIE